MFDSAALRVIIVQTQDSPFSGHYCSQKSDFRGVHHQAIHSKVIEQNLVW